MALKPKKLNFTEAASLPYAHLTMWSALCDGGGITEQNAKNKRYTSIGTSSGISRTLPQPADVVICHPPPGGSDGCAVGGGTTQFCRQNGRGRGVIWVWSS